MRAFVYGFIGFILSIILFLSVRDHLFPFGDGVILLTILCGCTGSIVSAIRYEKEKLVNKTTTKEDEQI